MTITKKDIEKYRNNGFKITDTQEMLMLESFSTEPGKQTWTDQDIHEQVIKIISNRD